MKKRLLVLLSVVLMFAIHPEARAGFWAHKAVATGAAAAMTTTTEGSQSSLKKEHTSHIFSGAKQLVHPSFAGMAYRGWVGILALLCGVAGFFYPGFGFAAMLFGLIGMGRRHRNSGIAIAGFVLGVCVVLLTFFASFEGFPLY